MQINSAAQNFQANAATSSPEKCCDKIEKQKAGKSDSPESVDYEVVNEIADSKASGVLKNLMNGHYKGVADVRLRINFADQIAALETEQATQIAIDGATNAVQNVTGQMATLVDSDNLTDEQAVAVSAAVSEFESNATSIIENLADTSATSPATTIEDLRSYFVVLTEAITAATATEQSESEATETSDEDSASIVDQKNVSLTNAAETIAADSLTIDGVEADDPISTDNVPEFSIENFLADLIDSFEAAMQQLTADLNSSSVLPAISEPSGQGKAYDKFMAIYNEMNQPFAEQPVESEIDVLL